MKQKKYVLYCKPSSDYSGVDGRSTKDLNRAFLFTWEQVSKRSEQFSPNFEFFEVIILDNTRKILVPKD